MLGGLKAGRDAGGSQGRQTCWGVSRPAVVPGGLKTGRHAGGSQGGQTCLQLRAAALQGCGSSPPDPPDQGSAGPGAVLLRLQCWGKVAPDLPAESGAPGRLCAACP